MMRFLRKTILPMGKKNHFKTTHTLWGFSAGHWVTTEAIVSPRGESHTPGPASHENRVLTSEG